MARHSFSQGVHLTCAPFNLAENSPPCSSTFLPLITLSITNLPPTASASCDQSGNNFSLSVLRGIVIGAAVFMESLAVLKQSKRSGVHTMRSLEFFPPQVSQKAARLLRGWELF